MTSLINILAKKNLNTFQYTWTYIPFYMHIYFMPFFLYEFNVHDDKLLHGGAPLYDFARNLSNEIFTVWGQTASVV
jgi:hypothetical protein